MVEVGADLGRYQIGEELGTGGMATVFRARDRELRRDVAIKVLFPHLCRNREVVSRFHREARAAAALDHRHILRVFDVGGGDTGEAARGELDPPYMVLELVRGPSLDVIAAAHGALLAEVVAAVGAALCGALAQAHRAGVIHRDVKPANVLIAEGGRIVLGDFGVARVADDESSVVTRTGALLGTPAFLSPEQATGGQLDARSDLYSLGATLYQLATGSLPVAGNAVRAVALIAAGEVVPPLRRNPRIGVDLARVIERLMRMDPDARFADAGEAEAALRAVVASGLGDAPVAPETTGGAGRAPGGDPEELVRAFFADPVGCQARLLPVVVAQSLAGARAAAASGQPVRALALTDRALALDPDNRDALALIDAIGRGRVRRRTIALGLAVVAAGAACWGALAMWPVSSEKDEVADGATAAAAAVGAASRAPGRSGGAATAEPVRAGVVLPGSSAGASGARAASSAPDEAGAVPPGPSAGSSAALSARSSAAPSAPDLGSSAAASPPHAREHAVAGASDPQRGTRPRGAIDDDSATRARARTARNRDGDGDGDRDRDRRPIPVDRDAPSSVASTQSGPASTQSGPASTRPDPASTQSGPASTQSGPASTQSGPASTQSGPASTRPDPASAAAPSSVSAAPAAAPAARAPVPAASTSPADAIITLEMDAWCRVTVEGKPVGQARPRLELRLSPGAHTIACAQDIRGRRWSERITARSGERRVVRGRVLPPPVAVTVALRHGDAVRIDRKRVVDGGASIQLPVGRYRIELLRDGAPIGFGFADLRGPPCTLVDEPAIACR